MERFFFKCMERYVFPRIQLFLSLTFSHLNIHYVVHTYMEYKICDQNTKDTLYDEQKNSIILWQWIFRLKALRR